MAQRLLYIHIIKVAELWRQTMQQLLTQKRLSSVSVALRNVQHIIEKTPTLVPTVTAHDLYSASIANTQKSRLKAFQLAYEVYLAKGYISPNSTKMLISKSDFMPNTCIININDGEEVVASVTLNFQSKNDLPCQELYAKEVQPLLDLNYKLVEITRLVIKENHRHSNLLLAQLFQATFIFAYQIKNVEQLVIEVNPRHIAFYQRLLGFNILGGEKECERVNNAPAYLLHLNLNYVNNNLQKFYNNNLEESSKYKFFKFALPLHKSLELKESFKKSYRPISFTEKIYFGLQQVKTHELTGAN